MGRIAVIDTETNWYDEVMSIGMVVGEWGNLQPIDWKYYILDPECRSEGMYSDRLDLVDPKETMVTSREKAMEDLKTWLRELGVEKVFAYNARFDWGHLPELREFVWYDIMRLAAYRQYNPYISPCAECCSTGRLKRCYGVEPISRLLRQDPSYRETHNALLDAVDELKIMELLGASPVLYEQYARI